MGRGSNQADLVLAPRTKGVLAKINKSKRKSLLSPQEIITGLKALSATEAAALEESLKPGASSHVGFLSKEESLLSVIENDVAALAAVGLTPQEVGIRLQEVLTLDAPGQARYRSFTREQFDIPDYIDARMYAPHKGGQSCPFEEERVGGTCGSYRDAISAAEAFGSHNFEIINAKTKEKIKGPGLLPHLIICHNFFEGHGPYRVDPIALAQILEMI
jgi:hypothetical protein